MSAKDSHRPVGDLPPDNWRLPFESEDHPERAPGPIYLNRYREEAHYQGFQTFLKLPVCLTPADLEKAGAEIAVCGVPFEMVVTRGGPAQAPNAIRACDYLPVPPHERPHLSVRVDPLKELRIVDYGDSPATPYSPEKSVDAIRSFVREIAETGAVPIILGGDHSITWPDVAAMADVHGPGRVGVVHFDAHADTAPHMFGTLYSHGSPMRRLIEDGHLDGRNFIQIGLRGYWPGPDVLEWMREHGLRSHFMAEIESRGFEAVMERAIDEALDGAERLFISLDIDVLDPSCAPGTGAPEPGGLTTRELLPMIRRLAHEVGICGMDISEVSPPYDTGNPITALAAHRAATEAMTGLAMRKIGIKGRAYYHPEATGSSEATDAHKP